MIASAPQGVISPKGCPYFGAYSGSISNTSFRGLSTVASWRLAIGQKRWMYIGIYSPELIACACVIDLTYMASGFMAALDCKNHLLLENKSIAPRWRQIVPDTPSQGIARFALPKLDISICGDSQNNKRTVQAKSGRGNKALALELEIDDDPSQLMPLSAITPKGGASFHYTHKAAGLPVKGIVRMGSRMITLRDALAVVDYTHGLTARHTHWLWASAAGVSEDGRQIGINLIHSETEEQAYENAIWIDGQLVKVGPTNITQTPAQWTITNPNVSLRFSPQDQRSQHVNVKIIASKYIQPLGYFDGQIHHNGETINVSKMPGVTEIHDSIW